MRVKLLLIIFLTFNMLGCATVLQGNFAKVPVSLNKAIINDSINCLVTLYPPAHTRFHLKQTINDSFGVSLIELLRQKGYSINESSMQAGPQGGKNVDLYYLLDEPIKGTLYRITLTVGKQSLSRAYTLKKGTFTPVGFWVRKE